MAGTASTATAPAKPKKKKRKKANSDTAQRYGTFEHPFDPAQANIRIQWDLKAGVKLRPPLLADCLTALSFPCVMRAYLIHPGPQPVRVL